MRQQRRQQAGQHRFIPPVGWWVLLALGILAVIGGLWLVRNQQHRVAGRAAFQVAAYRQAIDAYTTISLRHLGKDDLRNLAVSYRQLHLEAEAQAVDQVLTKRDPTDPVILLRAANLAAQTGQAAAAEQQYRALIDQQPTLAGGYVGLARLLHRQGQTQQAYDLLSPTSAAGSLQLVLLLERASLAAGVGDTARATETYQAILRLDPANQAAHIGLGQAPPPVFPNAVIEAAQASQ